MASLAFSLLVLACCLVWVGVMVSVARFASWLAASRSREKVFYALVVSATVTGCAYTGVSEARYTNSFHSGREQSHREWVARVKADRL